MVIDFPRFVRGVSTLQAREELQALRKRKRELGANELALQLAAIAMNSRGRRALDDRLEGTWQQKLDRRRKPKPEAAAEVIVGGGLHASIYAATRHLLGFERPMVIERHRPGGAFALSRSASFWTNSRNRPGLTGLPSENRALNFMPGAPVQLADFSGREFQDNADWAFVIRASLAMHADVRKGEVAKVESVDAARWKITLADDRVVYAARVIDARGFGDPRREVEGEYGSILSFPEFLGRMDRSFPLEGMKRVAIVGSGNSALCVAEALLGVNPAAGFSVASLDWVEQVDLYGDFPETCEDWREQQRGRYQALGSFLKPLDNGTSRMRVFGTRGTITPSLNSTFVNGRLYDHVVTATGWELPPEVFAGNGFPAGIGNAPCVALRLGTEAYRVGPAADLAFESFEAGTTDLIQENKVALFRLGPRTAALAARLGKVVRPEIPVPVKSSKKAPSRKQAEPQTGRLPLGNDRNGVPIYAGDKIRYENGLNDLAYEGVAIKAGTAANTLVFNRIRPGFDPDRRVRNLSNITNIEPVQPQRTLLDRDVNGAPLYAGDRVRYVLRNSTVSQAFEGTLQGLTRGFLAVKRDDGVTGEPDGTYTVAGGSFLLKLESREELGLDRDGTQMFVGDRVDVQVASARYSGVLTGSDAQDNLVQMKRDDGLPGGGKDDAWRINRAYVRVVKRESLGYDKDSKPIFEGDRVSVDEDSIETFTGTVVKGSYGGYQFCVKRDDGQLGVGPGGAWILGAPNMTVEKL